MFIEIKKKNQNVLNIANHLSAKPAENSNSTVKDMQKSSSRRSAHSQTRSKASSDMCCAVHALNVVSILELKRIYFITRVMHIP